MDVLHRRPAPPDLGAHRHRPRPGDLLRRRAGARPAVPHGARPPRRRRRRQGDRPAGRADLRADRGRSDLRGDPDLGRAAVAGGGLDGARAGQLALAQGRARGPRPPRLHPERGEQDARGALQRPAGRRGARLGARSRGTSSTIRTSGPTAGRSTRSANDWRSGATPSAPCWSTHSACRALRGSEPRAWQPTATRARYWVSFSKRGRQEDSDRMPARACRGRARGAPEGRFDRARRAHGLVARHLRRPRRLGRRRHRPERLGQDHAARGAARPAAGRRRRGRGAGRRPPPGRPTDRLRPPGLRRRAGRRGVVP